MISNRLKAIASLVDTESIIDVGCDHALLDIYLTNKGISCRGTDISSKCLELAYKNLIKYNLENKIKLINTDGLKGINIYKTDTIVIAGMGTKTILNIIKDVVDNPLIIVSNNDLILLRKNVIKKGYYIEDEIVIKEKKYYYVIIKFKKGNKKYKYKDYLLGPILKKSNIEYYKHLHDKYLINYNKIPKRNIIKKVKEKIKIKIIDKNISILDNQLM